jgi:hypothetical protein
VKKEGVLGIGRRDEGVRRGKNGVGDGLEMLAKGT